MRPFINQSQIMRRIAELCVPDQCSTCCVASVDRLRDRRYDIESLGGYSSLHPARCQMAGRRQDLALPNDKSRPSPGNRYRRHNRHERFRRCLPQAGWLENA